MNKTIYFHSLPPSGQKRITVAGIVSSDMKTIFVGFSSCSKKDQFNKKKGRLISEGRAYKAKALTESASADEIAKLPATCAIWNIEGTPDDKIISKFVELAAKETNSLPRNPKSPLKLVS